MSKQIITERQNKVVYSEGEKCYKVFGSDYNKASILNEAHNQSLVEETGLNIPALLEIVTIDGHWAIVTELIHGETLDALMEANPEKEDEYLERFVDIQIDMQSKRVPLLTKHRDKMNQKIAQTDLSATLRYDLHNRIEATPRHNDLCHGDFNPSNVIINENNEAYIIDWAHATQGNCEADAARTFLLFLLDGKSETAKKYLSLFCEKSGCSCHDILNWLPILAASQSVKGIKKQSSFLQKLIFMNKKELEALYE